MKKTLLGLEVDEKIFKEFSEKKFRVPGDPDNKERSLKMVEFFSKSREYMDELPEFAKECRKIVEQVSREVTAALAAKTGAIGYFTAQKHRFFSDYLRDLQKLHGELSAERLGIEETYKRARRAYEDGKKNTFDEIGRAKNVTRWAEAEETYKDSLKALEAKVEQEISAVREEFSGHVMDFYRADGSMLDDSTVKLLNCGIKLRDEEIESIVANNTANPTMIRLVSDYCEKMGIDNTMARHSANLANRAGKDEMAAFDEAVELIRKATGSDSVDASTWGCEKGNFAKIVDRAIAKIDSLPVSPGRPQRREID